MKKFFISVGLAAAGTASLQAAYAPGLNSMETTKFWSVAGTLRGFYDDNFTTSPNGQKQGSWGYELSPSIGINLPLQQTEFDVRYTYGLYYYQERQNQGNNPYDQTHQVDLWLDHAFSERWQSTVHDTFVVGQEPGLLTQPGSASPTPYRANGNNIANNANVALTTDWTRLFSTVLSYDNGYYDYEQSGGGALNPSQNGLLTRDEQSVGLDLQWELTPEIIGLVGYAFDFVNYWGNEVVAQNQITGASYYSDSRNSYSHIPYLGVKYQVLANLNFSIKAGAQYTENYNDSSSPNFITPYVVSTASYTYAEGSYAQLGFTHEQNATYVVAPSSTGQITQSQQSSVISASVNQEITAKLMGSIIGNVQLSRFNQGLYNNNSEQTYGLGVNLTYTINQHLSTEVGYNFDDFQSNIPNNGYSRNRVYLGVTAAY